MQLDSGRRGSIHSLLTSSESQERKETDILLNDFSMGPTGRWLVLVTFELSLGNSRDL